MDDLQRIVDDPGSSGLGRTLIASAGGDTPSPDSRARAARRLGIAAGLVVGAGVGSELGALAAAWKVAAVMLALGGVVGLAILRSPTSPPPTAPGPVATVADRGTAERSRAGDGPRATMVPPEVAEPRTAAGPPAAPAPQQAAPRTASSARPRLRAAAPPAEPTQAPFATPPGIAQDPVEPELVEPELATGGSASAPPGAAADPTGPATVASTAEAPLPAPPLDLQAGPGRLAAEVALVDRARALLHSGDHTGALAALAEYHARFATGDLDAEADVVTLEVVIAQRDVARARALGAAFLARSPRSPLAQRVHSLLEHLPM